MAASPSGMEETVRNPSIFGNKRRNSSATAARLRRTDGAVGWVIGCLMIAATIEIFIRFVYPANELTQNWTAVPADWEMLRQQWEYGQAANAILTFIGLCAVTGSVVSDEGVEEL